MANLFVKAAKAPVDTKPVKSGKERKEVTMEGVRQYAELMALDTAIKSLLGTMAAEIKETCFANFVEDIQEHKKPPESFNAIEGFATVNAQMRKRGTNSPLSQDELNILEGAGIKAHEEVAVQELFAINPAYAEDEKLLAKVSKAIEKIVPEDFIIQQQRRAKMVVDDAAFNAAFNMPKIDETVIRTVTTMALKPKLTVVDIDAILEDVKGILGTNVK